ncbi:hypothetical protein D3C87_1794440 [compost metagenome]
MPMRLQLGDVLGHFLTRPAWTPHVLNFIKDDGRAIRHGVRPRRRVGQLDVWHLEFGNAEDVDRTILADAFQQRHERVALARAGRASDKRDHEL